MKGDIGMANYEKQVEQEAAYPIPISLYNCYRTVRHEKRYQEYIDSYASLLLPHCPAVEVRVIARLEMEDSFSTRSCLLEQRSKVKGQSNQCGTLLILSSMTLAGKTLACVYCLHKCC